jgi:TPR repeat protein
VAQDYAKARDWYKKAADKGDADAKARIEQLPILERGAEASGKKTTTAASITITCPHCGTLNRVPPERHNDEGARCGKCHESLFPRHASLGGHSRIVGKWKEDTRVIAAILQDLGKKLRVAGFQANFQATAPKSSAIASGVIVGQFEGMACRGALLMVERRRCLGAI